MLKHFYTWIKCLLAQKTVWLNFLGSKVYSRSPSHCLSYDHLPDRSSAPSPAVKQVPAGCHQQWVSCRWAHMHWSSKSIQRPGCERPVDFPCWTVTAKPEWTAFSHLQRGLQGVRRQILLERLQTNPAEGQEQLPICLQNVTLFLNLWKDCFYLDKSISIGFQFYLLRDSFTSSTSDDVFGQMC